MENTMRKKSILTLLTILLSSILLFAQTEAEPSSSGGIDWFQLTITVGYLLGVFVLLPIVIYTNMKEKLFDSSVDGAENVKIIEGLSEEERNERAAQILEKIEENLTAYKAEDGTDMVTITKGKQARFMKQGLDYINKNLLPTDSTVLERVKVFSDVYADRTRRAFTGSKWIIGCSAAVGILFVWTAGISTFIFIHFLGLLFYILSSRTAFYTIEKRMSRFGGNSGILGKILTGLFIGNGVKYYVSQGGGPWKRDWQTEGEMALFGLLLMIFVAFLLGIFAAFLGVINTFLNYSTSYLIPFMPNNDWYEKNFLV
jgi:hypothetical protein